MAATVFWKTGWFIGLGVVLSLLLIGLFFLTARRGQGKTVVESAETRRLLGLAFQGQGQLDQAYDKFCQCPMNEVLMEDIYNLGLDFERHRQFNKAEAAFRYLSQHKPNYRDLALRLKRGQPAVVSAPVVEAPAEKRRLDHYQLEATLGKGAMGLVYLAHDTRHNRPAAIKTMALAQAFDEDELADVKSRFFREAETAGRLKHPNIVTIYDAGEAAGLAYIAMEFLPGHDLVPHSKLAGLLPLAEALSILARVADALDYAHRQNVVHRDIKPANIMYTAASDQVKVTDFGIARLTDSSRTKTGMVLGSPAYMSPEQLNGQKIDGRSDLFSLGVVLYQMCCGQPPFSGDSLGRLMFKIASEAPPDILGINPALPAELVAVITKALSKNVAGRYQNGAEMAAALRRCRENLMTGAP
ncbi:MAG: serine/threonine-protein kinase [Azonexus sp.]|nr:serine/threonine-protein kinase [Azonexus sp.]